MSEGVVKEYERLHEETSNSSAFKETEGVLVLV